MSEIRKEIALLKEAIQKASYAKKQEEYEAAYKAVFQILDELESHLTQSPFLEGDQITEADHALYEILIRFDTVYYFRSGLNNKRISEYDALWDYARALYAREEFRSGTNLEAIKKEEYLKDPEYNPLQIIPLGPELSEWEKKSSPLRSGSERL